MKIKFYSIIPVIILLSYFYWDDDNEPDLYKTIHTGVMLDSLDNEVMLMTRNGNPEYYFSSIFTPVCNTGECLPVRINIYWDLTGKYLRYDQPEGEILTKIDHEPFTEDDYDLLDEILRGPDPRYGGQNLHGDSGVKHNKNDSPSQPAPQSRSKISKYDMVDGITGSTLPEIKDKFVPGALYTTYTLWGLANDHLYDIRDYTEENLIVEKYYEQLLNSENRNLQDMVIQHLVNKNPGEHSRRNVLISLLDTGSVNIQLMTLNKFYWDDYRTDEVQLAMHNKFYNGNSVLEVKQLILQRWGFNFISDSGMKTLSENVHNNPELMNEIIALYQNKVSWPDGVFDNLVDEYGQLTTANQEKLMNLFKSHKAYLSKKEWKIVKSLEE